MDSEDKKGTSRIDAIGLGFLFFPGPYLYLSRRKYRMDKLWVVGIGLVLLGFSGPRAWAAPETVTMDKVVVTASRQAEATTRVPASITVVTAEEIENSTAQNVAEVLTTLAGFHVMDTGGNKRNYWVDLRGFGESAPQNLLLMVDGRRVNLPDLSGPDWNLIPLERIARIEVIRGSRGTVLYGDNATQGVVNIITKEGSGLAGNVTTQYGSYNTVKGNAAVSGAHGILAYDISASSLYSEGYRDNSDTIAKDLGANLRIDPTDKVRLHLSAGHHYDDTRNPGGILDSQFDDGAERSDTFSPNDFSKVNEYYFKTGLELDMLSNDTFKLEASIRNRDKQLYGSSPAYWFEAETQTDIVTLSPQFIFREDFDGISNRITLGADYTQSSQDYDNYSEYFGSPSEIVATLEKENSAFYFHDNLSVGDRLSISGGYRVDRVTFKYEPATPVTQRTFDEEGYTVGVNYAFGPKSHLYGSYTHGFRYPALDEQFYYFNSTVDTSIEPQTSDDFEIGASAEVAPDLMLALNFFRSKTEDEIFFNFSRGFNKNLDGDVTRQGAELGLAWQYKMLFLSGAYTHTDIDIDGGQFEGNTFPFVPEDKATATARLKFGWGLSLGLEAIHTGERVLIGDWDNGYDKVDAYTVFNGKVQYAWRKLTFFANLNNIFSEEYSAFSGLGYNSSYAVEPGHYPAPDFNFLLGVTARFGAK
jgi:iron complex outermembrane recepter protein